MNPKTTIFLVVALIVAVGGVWWAQSSSTQLSDEPVTGPRSLFDPPLGEVQSFEIVQTATGSALKFELEEDPHDAVTPKKWRMIAPLSGTAEQHAVTADVDRIKQLQYIRSYALGEDDRPTDEMTSLANPLRIVKLTDLEGSTHVVRIGATQRLSTHTYVQREGDDTIYLADADLNAELRRGLSDYRGKRVVEFSQHEAVRIETAGEHQYTLVKSGAKWVVEQPTKARADAGKVGSLLTSLANLAAERFVEDDPATLRPYGLENPRFAVTVSTEHRIQKELPPPPASPDEEPAEPEFDVLTSSVRLLIGATVEESAFAKVDDPASPAVFQITSAAAKQIMQSLDELRDRKIADIAVARAQKFALTSPAGSVELTSESNTWKITAGLPFGESRLAEFVAVDDVIKTVRNMTAVGFETDELPTQGFDNPSAVVEMGFEGTIEPIRLVFGAMTPSGTGVYVKNERENFVAVVKADTLDHFTVSPVSFMTRELLRLEEPQISRLELTYPDRSCAVARQEGTWRFVEPIGGAVETQAVSGILGNLSMLRGRKVVALASDAAKYGLDEPAVKLAITVQAPPPPPPPESDAEATEDDPMPPAPTVHRLLVSRRDDAVYAMVEGGETICEVDPKLFDDLTAELLDRRVAAIEPSEVRRLRFAGASAMTFDRVGDGWQLEGEPTFPVDAMMLTQVLDHLRDLRAERYVQYRGADLKEYGLDAPAVAVTVEMGDGEALTLMISSRGPRGYERYAAVAALSGRVFVIGEDDAEEFLKQVADFQRSS